MQDEDLINKLGRMKKPGFAGKQPDQNVKLAIIGSKKSAAAGVWFLVVPFYFLLMMLMKYYFNVNLHIIDIFEELAASLDRSSGTKFITPLLFLGLPAAGIVINLLSIMFFEYDKKQKLINISIRLKLFNVIVILASSVVILIFMLYLITENFHLTNN